MNRTLLICLTFVFFAFQLLQLLPAFQVGWPFSSYKLFHHNLDRSASYYLLIELEEDDGSRQFVRPANVIPLEFYLANRVVIQYLLDPAESTFKQNLMKLLLSYLNNHPWYGIHGIYPAAEPRSGNLFVGLRALNARYDLSRADRTSLQSPQIVQHGYSYEINHE